jgi:hypothetical protein
LSASTFATFWQGPLNALVYSCLASFPAVGARLVLYAYGSVDDAPKGIEVRDAREICPDPTLTERYWVEGKRSLATFSDRFRYEMMLRVDHCWVDADIVCLKLDAAFEAKLVWGRQPEALGKALINNAVLKLPPDHPVLKTMLAKARAAEGQDISWGAIGPYLLTEAAEAEGVYETSAEPRSFYPIAPDAFWRLIDPASRSFVEEAASEAVLIHLWSELLRRVGYDFDAAPPPGAYLYEKFGDLGMLSRFRRVCEVAEVEAIVARWNASAPAA